MRPADERYFERVEAELDRALDVANAARERGGDPESEVEIPVARDMADRVENILGIDGVAERVRDLEGRMSREEAALALVEDFVQGTVGDYETRAGTIEGAVRTAVALLTEGVVAAPIEGIDRVEVLENDDGTEFVNVYYAGPIRSAGGTAQALSVLVADYARTLLGIDEYEPRAEEIGRYAEEVALYDGETGLQYSPSEAEAEFIAEHVPIMLDGEPTGDEEVSGYRDVERVDTNAARGGMCLVLAEGIALKAPKIRRYTRELAEVEWPWLRDLIDGSYKDDNADAPEDPADADADAPNRTDGEEPGDGTDRGPPRPEPSEKYLEDLIAGRPVFSHPSTAGGFRLRYGRARNHGHATAGVHPATMHLVDDFLAPGTQVKTERPGKAAGVVPVDTIEGPTVRLATGEVRRVDDPGEAREIRNGVEEILDLGEYLVNYGEFVENNHPLAPAAYAVEWWVQEFEAAGGPVRALRDAVEVDLGDPSPAEALEWATEYDAPLHPAYTYLWHDVSVADAAALADALEEAAVAAGDGAAADAGDGALVLPRTERVRRTLEALLVEHTQHDDRLVVPEWRPLARTLGFEVRDAAAPSHEGGRPLARGWTVEDLPERVRSDGETAIEAIEAVAPFAVRERAPTRVGNRMGRPEKSEQRELSPAVHTLFPIGEAGGDRRDVGAAADHGDAVEGTRGEIEVEVGRRDCADCGTRTYRARCPECNGGTEAVYVCPDCDREVVPDESARAECPRCGTLASQTRTATIDVGTELHDALESLGERPSAFDTLKGVKGLSSAAKLPEPVEKGVLRAKHGVSAFKDGTVRYDMTDLPVTAVRPAELDVTAADMRELGYRTDLRGDPLEHDDQLVELKVQDVVLSEGAADHLLRTADFVDDLLTQYYGLEAYYDVDDRDDLVGELVFGMAPHTSAAVVGRVVGFTSAAVGYAHPYFHASKRRNCFHPETKVWFEDEDEWHHDTIETLVEERLDDPETDDFGTLVEKLDGDVHVPSLTENGGTVRKPVRAVSKHPAPDHMLRVETRGGRTLTVTPDHSMVRWDGRPKEVAAHELEPGDSVPVFDGLAPELVSPVALRADGGDPRVEPVERVQYVPTDVDHTYCLTVEETHRLAANGIHAKQCDGDEDCVMLLMDGLLNFSRTYLPDQRGGSVAAESRLVAVDPEGDVRFMTFESFWNELTEPIEVDGKFRKRTCADSGWQTYTFDDEHRASLQPIERAIRYPADDEQLVRVETQFGRELEITENHSLFRYDDGIEETAGSDLSKGDLVVAPQELDIETRQTTIDIAACVDEPYVFIDDHVEDLLRTAWETTDHGSETHQQFTNGLAYRLNKRKVPFDRFEAILESAGFAVPRDVDIGLARSSEGIARTIDIDEDVAWLLGLYVAEGSTSSDCPTIYNADEDLIDRAAAILEDALGHEPGRRWSNRAYELRFPAVFAEVLYDLGFERAQSYDSSEKVIPACIRHAPEEHVRAFLRGFIAGDGSNQSDDNVTTVSFYTTSEDVKDGMVFLLHRLGLVADVERTDREGNRQDIYTVTVSGGANDNPLHRVLAGDDPYLPKSPRDLPPGAERKLDAIRPLFEGDLSYLRVKRVEHVDYDGYLYDLQVGGDPVFTANWLYAHNSMDAPLVMSSRVDPAEIDDEAHNVDIMREYPREFYEATREMADPAAVAEEMTIAEETLGTDDRYRGFDHTHDTGDIAAGPDLSAYKTLGSMEEKMDAQLRLSRKLRAVEESDVAERIIEYHFLPDLLGNLKAFTGQEVRCLGCGTKYRRAPLSGDCRACGGDVTLTVHEGSVTKYLETAIRVAEEFGTRSYTKQRLQILEKRIERLFENDQNKAATLGDYM